MEVILLIICVVASWVIGTTVDRLPDLGTLLVPGPWLLGAIVLVLVTWLMRD
ncbi:hypothetical protein [Nodosilinea sp. E11]|uniref:hypothetical protein n=1 Tax=Nodosilinea sp. E11 TaxID=3037479 RepID=UPI002934B51E|nr:hypothetical protein [Nodosilinea sp. E11]WOD38679.1 hypothetical protein RRF56_20930 [Nodosilinea sp. E11]